MKTTETTETTEVIRTDETTEAAGINTKTSKKHFFYEKRLTLGIPIAGFATLGYATGEIIHSLCASKDILSWMTGLAGVGIGLLVAGAVLLSTYKRHDKHYLSNL
jgi:hypothetical protein